MAGGLDMSFWIWVGVAIVVVLVVAFARDRLEQRHGRATREVTLNVASKGETLSATRTRASSGEAAAVAGDPSSAPGTTTPFGKPRLGCQPEHQPQLALGVPVGGGEVRVVPRSTTTSAPRVKLIYGCRVGIMGYGESSRSGIGAASGGS